MPAERILAGLASLLGVAAISIGGHVAGTLSDLRTEMATERQIRADMQADLQEIKQDRKFWKLHSWARQEINKLRQEAGLPLAEWPDLDN